MVLRLTGFRGHNLPAFKKQGGGDLMARGSMNLDSVVARSGKILHTDVDGDVTMMSVETGRYYSVSAVGARIWALLEQPRTGAQICDALLTEYRIERSRCEAEVLHFLGQLAEEQVVVTNVK